MFFQSLWMCVSVWGTQSQLVPKPLCCGSCPRPRAVSQQHCSPLHILPAWVPAQFWFKSLNTVLWWMELLLPTCLSFLNFCVLLMTCWLLRYHVTWSTFHFYVRTVSRIFQISLIWHQISNASFHTWNLLLFFKIPHISNITYLSFLVWFIFL